MPCFWHTERVVRKATTFRDGANKTAPPCETLVVNKYLATVPVEQLQRNITLQKILLLGKTVFSVRQKGVPPLLLPASMLQLPRCLVRIYNLDAHDTTLSEFAALILIIQLCLNLTASKNAIAAGKTDCKI